MFSTERWSLKFITHITVVVTFLQIRKTASFCIEGSQYYNDIEKVCVPCTICASPNIVITPCSDFSNTLCGLPKFGKNLDLVGISQVSQEKIPKRKEFSHRWDENKSKNRLKKLRKRKYHKKGKKFKNFKKVKRKLNVNRKSNVLDSNTSSLDKKENSSTLTGDEKNRGENLNFLLNNTVNVKENLEPFSTELIKSSVTTEYVELPITTEYVELLDIPNTTEVIQAPATTKDIQIGESSIKNKKKGFTVLSVGKYVVLSAVGTANILLLLIAIVNVISCLCCKKRSKDRRSAFFCNQKLPNPSQKPIKCRFTAVLPSKSSPEYANVDSYMNPIISTCEVTDDAPTTTANSCSTGVSQSTTSQNTIRSENVSTERDSSARDPLISTTSSNPEVIERANTIQLYSRMPSPNPFTMDRLLESRRAVGYPSVENNLYVETWCSSPSPVLSRSQNSSVTPSPAPCLRKPFSSYSSSSSPLTTRTFRATPAFLSFQPQRS